MTTKTVTPTTHTLDVPGAVLAYDIRLNEESLQPALLMIGGPMAAAGFETLAGHFTDRTVITYDPRGSERSQRESAGSPLDPDIHGVDLHRLLDTIDLGPVDLFASSGGAVNALALVAKHPEQVRLLVAHEPPLASILPDRDAAFAAVQAVSNTYRSKGWGAGMAHFIALVGHRGPFAMDFAEQPGPDPAMFGMPAEDDGSRDDVLLSQYFVSCAHYEPDFDSLLEASTRIIPAAGVESEGEMAHRGAEALAERLGLKTTAFPSHHGGFLGGEYGQTGDPDAFAAALREVLAGGVSR